MAAIVARPCHTNSQCSAPDDLGEVTILREVAVWDGLAVVQRFLGDPGFGRKRQVLGGRRVAIVQVLARTIVLQLPHTGQLICPILRLGLQALVPDESYFVVLGAGNIVRVESTLDFCRSRALCGGRRAGRRSRFARCGGRRGGFACCGGCRGRFA